VKLVGTVKENIADETALLFNNTAEYDKMRKAHNPYGDGLAAQRIVSVLDKHVLFSS
jgi:UDP-N-acetylglucosamine 2-epimerase (non-hydrolysing)